jgi:transposase InsO family protein
MLNQLLQMDTHISDFRKLKHAHVTIDTISGFLAATTLTGEANKNVISLCLHYFSMLGVANQIKTDNGPGYYSQAFEMFCQQFNVTHVTGIFYNPQRQGIGEL